MELTVPDMTCGYCVYEITQAVKHADAEARVEVSLKEARVRVASRLAADTLLHVIIEAGFTPLAAAPQRAR